MGRFHDPRFCQLYSMGSQTKWEYSFIIHTFKLNLEIRVELYARHSAQDLLYILIIFARYNVHPNIIPQT